MLTDIADWLLLTNGGLWVGSACIFGSVAAIGWVTWRTLRPVPDPVAPRVRHTTTFRVPLPPPPPAPNYHRADAVTQVIGRIPPYLSRLEGHTEEIALPQAEGPSLDELDRLAAEHRAPVCPICGGGWHPVCPSKAADDCPLTTDEIRVPDDAPTPVYVKAGGTVDLAEKLKKVSAP